MVEVGEGTQREVVGGLGADQRFHLGRGEQAGVRRRGGGAEQRRVVEAEGAVGGLFALCQEQKRGPGVAWLEGLFESGLDDGERVISGLVGQNALEILQAGADGEIGALVIDVGPGGAAFGVHDHEHSDAQNEQGGDNDQHRR